MTEAFEYLGMTSEQKQTADIDLILMDIQVDEVDGIEAARRIKAKGYYRHVPVIMITGEDAEETLERAFNAGAVDYITKPLRKIELLSWVGSFLRLRQETLR